MSDQTDPGITDLVVSVGAIIGSTVAILLLVGPDVPLFVAFVGLVVFLGLTLALTLLVEFRASPTG